MKIMSIKKIVIALVVGVSSILGANAQMKVMTYNIRYDNQEDGDNWWENRKQELVQLIDFYHPDIFGIQEGLINQVNYIDESLPEYAYLGVGREDGDKKGEFSALYYDSTRYECLLNNTFWLSATPEKVSKGWDAACIRICTYGHFMNNKSGEKFWIFNVHFDHKGAEARINSAKLIVQKIKEITKTSDRVVVMGDFNSVPGDMGLVTIKKVLKDSREICEKPFYGPSGSFEDFNINSPVSLCLDYIFVKNFEVISCRNIDDRRQNNLYPSDHLPVLVELKNER